MKSFFKLIRKIFREIMRYFPIKRAVPNPILHGELLKGRVALITGGTRGIGYSISEAFVRNGASIIITGRKIEKINATIKKLKETNEQAEIYGFVLDNSNIKEMNEKFQNILSNIDNKKIDILVNNAGILNKTSFWNSTEEDFDSVINTNLKGTYFLTKIVAKYMVDNKIKGNILNVSSSSSVRPALTSYQLAKWGIRAFTKGLAKELSSKDIVVNSIAPGPTATDMLLEGDDNINRPSSPKGRYATSEEIASLSVILVSDLARMVDGDTLFATGGCGNLTFDDWN